MGSCCCQVLKVQQNEHLLLCGKNHFRIRFLMPHFANIMVTEIEVPLQTRELIDCT